MTLPSNGEGAPTSNAIATSTIGLGRIDVALIDASDRLRPVDTAKAQLIADSILAARARGEHGLDTPIMVRPAGAGFKLVIGAHRLFAVQLLGDTAIDAIVEEIGDLEARMKEVDENLCRAELNALDRAAFLAERDRVWRKMHPDMAGRKGSAKARWHHVSGAVSFAAEISERIGLSQRTVQRDVKLYRMLASTPEAIADIRGTWLENDPGQLKALASIPAADRYQVINRLFREGSPAKNVAAAIAEIQGKPKVEVNPEEAVFAALVMQWMRASARMRSRFLNHLDETGALDDYISGGED
jgi:ParB family chromosome partitioning protein